MRLVPVGAFPGLDYERHRKLAMRFASGFHDRLHDLCSVANLGFRDLEQQLVMDLQQHPRLSPALASAFGIRPIARLMMSAAEPCNGALMACRSAPARRAGLASRIPGMKHLRPKIVST